MNQHILIAGYWEKNLGDDCFLDIFAKRYPDSTIYILTQKKYRKFYQTSQIRVICYDSLLYRIINMILRMLKQPSLYYVMTGRKCDTAVILSGSYFMEESGWKRHLQNLTAMNKRVKKTFVIGTNFGPFHSEEFVNEYRKFFAMCTDVCFREQYSFELFKDLPQVRMAPDIVLGLDIQPRAKERRVILSVIDCNKSAQLAEYQQVYLEKMIRFAQYYLALNYSVTLFSFSEKQGDLRVCKLIAEQINEDRLEIYDHTDVATSLDKLNRAEIIIATRFHAMILGWVMDSKVIPIVYSKKMSNVIKDLGYTGEFFDMADIGSLDCDKTAQHLHETQGISPSLFILAKNQFSAFDAYWREIHE